MRKKMLFSMMFMAGIAGGLVTFPSQAMASVTQSQTIKVSGQVVDQDGQPLIGATVKVKNAKLGVVTDFDGKPVSHCAVMLMDKHFHAVDSASTDSAGYYCIANVKNNNVVITYC